MTVVEPRLFIPPPSPEEREWVARVDRIADLIGEYREQGEQHRATPQPVFEALRDAGISRMWVSEDFGGGQVALTTGSAVIQALARLDASVAWQMGVQGAIGRLSDYLPEPTSRKLFQDNTYLVVGGVNPSGSAERVPGGFRLTGEWSFASGFAHAGWLVCAARVTEGGVAVQREAGPELRMLFVSRDDVEFLDTWRTIGLRGTGSNSYRVSDVFVPEEFTVDQADMLRPPSPRPSRGYPVGYYDFGPFTSASTALGIARDAVDSARELTHRKTPAAGTATLAASHTVQEKLARAEMLVHSSDVLLRNAADQVTANGETGGDALSALVRLTAATVAEQTVAAVTIAFTLAGTGSIYSSSRLERAFRDIHSATKHITLSSSHFEMAGQYLLGGGLQMRR
ncbi:acyl-CoA dehydrogenase family protein [Nocardia terpenica]|uniref:Acyl-CoA dehydrogenase n=1 Tax=Nocardia terpenica TaxID=455432 RepID=A0A6G9Z8G4_9NOCA|nr:acyl-CoA dehydrogenase family protein [Nocardia terpenica]QIS21818.1 acyl-CoA dehydrogenase [Nocardia terpenica]